jgi:hypothetical protein
MIAPESGESTSEEPPSIPTATAVPEAGGTALGETGECSRLRG